MENSICAIELRSVIMKISRENIIWHWFHIFKRKTPNENDNNNNKKRRRRRRSKNEIIRYTNVLYYVFPYILNVSHTFDTLTVKMKYMHVRNEWTTQQPNEIFIVYVRVLTILMSIFKTQKWSFEFCGKPYFVKLTASCLKSG